MSIDKLINIFFTIVLVEMMVSIGLGVTIADVAGVAKNWRLVQFQETFCVICSKCSQPK